MRAALCILDGVIYEAVTFAQTENFETNRAHLVCPECNGPAYYRRSTCNGRDACFASRAHAEGCNMATMIQGGPLVGHGEGEEGLFTTGQRIVVNFNYGTQENGDEAQPTGGPPDTGNAGEGNGQGAAVRENTYRYMSSLLRSLIQSEEFRRSTQIIEVPGRDEEVTVEDFFLEFPDVTEDHINTYHGYWGTIQDARQGTGRTLWFNSGHINDDVSALLDHRHIRTVYQTFNIDNETELTGAHILVLGTLRVAGSGKRCVQIEAPEHVTIRLAR